MVYPWPSQIWYEDLNSIHVQIWQDWCDNNNVNLLIYFHHLSKLTLVRLEKLDIISKYFVPYDLHLNKEGNNLLQMNF